MATPASSKKDEKFDNSVLDQFIDYRENPHNWRDRKARLQLTFSTKKALERSKPNVGDASIYNIWYNNWYQASRNKNLPDQVPFTKCNPALDSGITRGSQLHKEDGLFCRHFAKGSCAKGHDCPYLHRIPIPADEERIDRTRDVFGRERHRLDRDDMGGVGSFERDNRTLYVGRVGVYEDVQDVVRKHFRQFGEIEFMKILHAKNVAFVKYKSRLNAEFAKEAMADQSLEHGECVNVRWATEDPNPNAIQQNIVESQQKMLDKVLTMPAYTQNVGVFYENQTEGDLNQYYEQQQLDYESYFRAKTGGYSVGNVAHATGRSYLAEQAREQGHALPASSGSKVLVYNGAPTAAPGGAMPPPPPPPKKAGAPAPAAAGLVPPPPPPRKPTQTTTAPTTAAAVETPVTTTDNGKKKRKAEEQPAPTEDHPVEKKQPKTRTRSSSPAKKAVGALGLVGNYASESENED